MEAYTDFSKVYDELMDETPYGEWCDFIHMLVEKYGLSKPVRDSKDALESERNLVLDLGCGTGTFTELMYEKGYDMVGVDNSAAMLDIAMKKREKSGFDILYLCQDMRELELYGTVGTVISVCDSVNYILDCEELKGVFKLVNNYLYPRGIFIFDFNTDYKYRDVIGDSTIAENRDDCSFIWENYYDEESGINEYDVTVFVEEESGLFRRFEETHFQRGYSVSEMAKTVEDAGMRIIELLDADTHGPITDTSERVYVIAGEQGKNL